MRKSVLFAGAVAIIAMASCTNDGVVNPYDAQDSLESKANLIDFSFRTQNISRANENLAPTSYNFGVWAAKSDTYATLATAWATDANKVMDHYLVGYYNKGVGGYLPKNLDATGTTIDGNLGSLWFYEGLGSDEYSATAPYEITSISTNAKQYLKYWDASKSYTFFLGYAPYSATAPTVAVGAKTASIAFKQIVNPDTVPIMYAATCAINSQYLGTGNKVPMLFYRILSQIQIAVWESVPGYKVEMGSVSFKGDSAPKNQGVVFIPAQDNLSDRGEYLYSGIPTATIDLTRGDTFNGTTNNTTGIIAAGTVSFDETTTTTSDANITFASTMKVGSPTGDDATNNYVSENRVTDLTYSPTVNNVLPADAINRNDGFQVVMNFTLVAEDTGERITVKGARAFVPADYTQWQPNTRYTYVFRITKGTTGTTTPEDPDPDPDPTPDPALYPIIFDDVQMVDMSTEVQLPGGPTDNPNSFDVN